MSLFKWAGCNIECEAFQIRKYSTQSTINRPTKGNTLYK